MQDRRHVGKGGFGTAIDLARLEDAQMLRAAGDVSYMVGVISVLNGEERAQVFVSGNVTARSDTEKKARRLMHRVELSIRRAFKCHGCGSFCTFIKSLDPDGLISLR